jgi:hypothetical protein
MRPPSSRKRALRVLKIKPTGAVRVPSGIIASTFLPARLRLRTASRTRAASSSGVMACGCLGVFISDIIPYLILMIDRRARFTVQ